MKRALVAYYSLTGNTAKVAIYLAARLGADLLQIRELAERRGFWGYLRAAFDSLRERPAVLGPLGRSAGDYDLIVVGTPVWTGKVTPAARAYLQTIRGKANRVAFFITSGATDVSKVAPAMEQLAGVDALAATGFTEAELRDAAGYQRKLNEFATTLRSAVPASEEPVLVRVNA